METEESEKMEVENVPESESTQNTSVEDDLMKELEKTIEMESETREKSSLNEDIEMSEENEQKPAKENENEASVEQESEINQPESESKVDEQEIEENSSKDKDTSTPPKSETPEDIINLLKSLSPEKLQAIKTKVLEISSEGTSASDAQNTTTDDKVKEPTPPPDEQQQQSTEQEATANSSDDVICLDSDDEEQLPPAESTENNEIPSETKPSENGHHENENQMEEGKTEENVLNGNIKRSVKECINPNCPRVQDDEYLECPTFTMSVYYVTKKPNKTQWVCSSCQQNALEIYEKLCTQISHNEPWFRVKVPSKQDLVEIIDSDEENEQGDDAESKRKEIAESKMIDFDEETELEVEEIISNLTTRINVNFQLEAEQKYIDKRMKKIDKDLEELQKDCKNLEHQSYRMYDELYSLNRPTIQRRPSLNLDVLLLESQIASDVSITVSNRTPSSSAVKSTAAAQRKPLVEEVCYAIRQRGVSMPHWMPARIIEDLSTSEEKKFKVQFNDNLANSVQIVSGKEISHPSFSEKLEIGARVIALFPRPPKKGQPIGLLQQRFLPGVIGEKLTQYNKRRYLVFCDYGQVKYCKSNEVRAIQESSELVWNDVHQNLRQFIRDYLESKTNRSRALLNVRINSQIMTERGGNWRKTVVQEVDCSLVRVYFIHEKLSEWLYRGSKRLYTMFQQAQRGHNTNSLQRRNDPAISFVEIDDDTSNDQQSGEVKKNIAKKSTAANTTNNKQPNQLQHQISTSSTEGQKTIILNDANIYIEDPAKVTIIKHFTPKKDICPKKYIPHECSETCVPPLKNNLSAFVPLAKPLLTCWERQILRHNKNRLVIYKAPCGRRLRDYSEVVKYFQMTKCFLNIENFDFDPEIHVLSSLVVEQSRCPLFIPDIANGKEGMKIQCINAFDDQRPPPLEYSPHRIPMNEVKINTDPEFMSCCDCTDECYDKSKCACFQLTIQGAKYNNVMEEDILDISYVFKRLLKAVPTGIYECNSRCKCSKRCLNKVVQHQIQVKMQLYRTKSRGWGLQSLHDIPKGTFICIYAGNLYSEKDANALCQGQDHGDEYFAELDLIENAEKRKEGFECGVVNPDDDDESDQEKDTDSDYDEKDDSHDYEDGDFVSKSKAVGNREIVTRSSRTSARQDKSIRSSASSTPQRTNSEDSSDDEMVNMMPNTDSSLAMRIPFRKLYGPKERVYIMDAKKVGNIGRYFNHSCDPNLFVQSVFVDTHDLRFPWIAFFTYRPIKAGEELCWNYNYEVGSVPSKVLYCNCGAKNCHGRIL